MLNNVDLNKNFFDDKIKHNIILLYSQYKLHIFLCVTFCTILFQLKEPSSNYYYTTKARRKGVCKLMPKIVK